MQTAILLALGVAGVGLHHLGHQLGRSRPPADPGDAARGHARQPGRWPPSSPGVHRSRHGDRRSATRRSRSDVRSSPCSRCAGTGCNATSNASWRGAYVSGIAMIVGAACTDTPASAIWAAAVALRLTSAGASGSGRRCWAARPPTEWTIEGSHFAERCEAFVIIALGESIVVDRHHLASCTARFSAAQVVAFVVAFAGTVGLWWVYFDRRGRVTDRTRHHATPPIPGRLGATRLPPGASGDRRRASSRQQPATTGARASAGRRGQLPTTLLRARRRRAVPRRPGDLQGDRVPRRALVADHRRSRAGAAARRRAARDGACARRRRPLVVMVGGRGGRPVTAPGCRDRRSDDRRDRGRSASRMSTAVGGPAPRRADPRHRARTPHRCGAAARPGRRRAVSRSAR